MLRTDGRKKRRKVSNGGIPKLGRTGQPPDGTHIQSLHASLLPLRNPSAQMNASGPAPSTVMSSIETTVVSDVPHLVSARAYSRQSAAMGPVPALTVRGRGNE